MNAVERSIANQRDLVRELDRVYARVAAPERACHAEERSDEGSLSSRGSSTAVDGKRSFVADAPQDEKGADAPRDDTGADDTALSTIVRRFGLSAFERDVLILCAGIELDARFAELRPTFGLALSVLRDAHWD